MVVVVIYRVELAVGYVDGAELVVDGYEVFGFERDGVEFEIG